MSCIDAVRSRPCSVPAPTFLHCTTATCSLPVRVFTTNLRSPEGAGGPEIESMKTRKSGSSHVLGSLMFPGHVSASTVKSKLPPPPCVPANSKQHRSLEQHRNSSTSKVGLQCTHQLLSCDAWPWLCNSLLDSWRWSRASCKALTVNSQLPCEPLMAAVGKKWLPVRSPGT